jgi:hypothetical protein
MVASFGGMNTDRDVVIDYELLVIQATRYGFAPLVWPPPSRSSNSTVG